MKFWIKTVFYLAGKLGRLVDTIDKEMAELSLCMVSDTFTIFDSMLKLEDKKRRLCNFKVIRDLMRAGLELQEKEIVRRHVIRGQTFGEIASDMDISKSKVNRIFLEAVKKCEAVAISLTYTEERFEKEYADIPLVFGTYKKAARKGRFSR